MLNAHDLINEIIVKVDLMTESRGVERCRLTLEVIQMLTALQNGIDEEQKTNESLRKQWLSTLSELTGETYTDTPIEEALKTCIGGECDVQSENG